jgi:hypothetical protein
VTTVYYLLHKRYEKQGLMPSHFNILQKGKQPPPPEKPPKA